MALDGTCATNKVMVITSNPVPGGSTAGLLPNPNPGCCGDYSLKVLADGSGNPTQNDLNTFIWWFDPIVTGATMALKKWNPTTGAWSVVDNLTSTACGLPNPFGSYVNNEGQNLIWFNMAWSNVLSLYGEGSYKVTCTYTIPIGSTSSVAIDSHEFCLKTYSPAMADGTVRLEYWLSGVTADIMDDSKIKDFGSLNIYNSLRLPGFFGYPKSGYKEEDIEYANGRREYVEDEQTPTYKLKLKLLPFFIHEIIRTDFMQADTLAITDYNSRNVNNYVQKFVRKDAGYEPKWYELQGNFASVELQFKQQINRTRKFRQ